MIFITWEKAEPHKKHDQYLLWVNEKTKMLDYVEFTIRDNYQKIPGSSTFYGSVKYADYRKIDGIQIAHKQIIFLNFQKKKENRYLHQVLVSEFEFDSFNIKELYPDTTLLKMGDRKK